MDRKPELLNEILTSQDETSGQYAAYLYAYETTPSGHVRPLLRVSSTHVFASALLAAQHLYAALKPEVQAQTRPPVHNA